MRGSCPHIWVRLDIWKGKLVVLVSVHLSSRSDYVIRLTSSEITIGENRTCSPLGTCFQRCFLWRRALANSLMNMYIVPMHIVCLLSLWEKSAELALGTYIKLVVLLRLEFWTQHHTWCSQCFIFVRFLEVCEIGAYIDKVCTLPGSVYF